MRLALGIGAASSVHIAHLKSESSDRPDGHLLLNSHLEPVHAMLMLGKPKGQRSMGVALESVVKWVGALAPFLAPYPVWVKAAFGVFVLSGATWAVGLVVAAPMKAPDVSADKPTDTHAAWLTIKGVAGFGKLSNEAVRVEATVNGLDYTYPTAQGIDWLEIGPEMAPQTFPIPVRDVYTVKFSAKVQNWPEGSYLASVEEQRVERRTNGVATYNLRAVNWGVRSAPPVVEIKYTISQGQP